MRARASWSDVPANAPARSHSARRFPSPARVAARRRSRKSLTSSAWDCSASLTCRAGAAPGPWVGAGVAAAVSGRSRSRARARFAFAISSALGRSVDAVKPRLASARPIAEVSVFSRQATALISPSPSRSDAQPVAAGLASCVSR